MSVVLNSLGCVCALGKGQDEIICRAKSGDTSGMFSGDCQLGCAAIPFGTAPVETRSKVRCHDLIKCAVGQIYNDIEHLKSIYPLKRLGVVIGASNTAVHEAQGYLWNLMDSGQMPKDFCLNQMELGMPAEFLADYIGFKGPTFTISTACSSAIKAFRSARDLLINDVCDAVMVGGVDARCDFALNGFNALGALSQNHTNPMSVNRSGINLGEGAALFIMIRGDCGIHVMGIGESSDAYHLTSPDPSGAGAASAMQMALKNANLSPDEINFINMHGTGTAANDAMESRAIYNVFGDKVLCASSKPMTGHLLGAGGEMSVALSWLMLRHKFIIPHVWDGVADKDCAALRLSTGNENILPQYILANAFAFGGSNASIILGAK